MKRAALCLPLLLLAAATGLTFPRFSAEQATSCKSCHVNPFGGGMRNEYGNHAVAFRELALPGSAALIGENYRSPRVAEVLTVGFDTRHLVFDDGTVFRMQTDAFAHVEPTENLSYQLRFGQDGVTENYALLSIKDLTYFVKAGRFYPAFGLRNSDHTSYNRTRTGHTSGLYLDGLSIGGEFGGINAAVEIFDRNGQAVYGFHAMKPYYVSPIAFFAGLSVRLSEDTETGSRGLPVAKAVLGGMSYDRFTLLGEMDLVGRANDTLIVYSSLTTRIEYGLYLVTEYNFFDGDRDLKSGVDEFLRLSVELYPVPFVQFRPSYTYYTRGILQDQDEFFLQFHVGY